MYVTIAGASSTFNGYGMYFKAGDYDQSTGSDGSVGARVGFYACPYPTADR